MTPDMDPAALAQALLAAVGGGQWALVSALGVFGLTLAAKQLRHLTFLGRFGQWLASPVGASVVAVVGSVSGAVGTAILAGAPLTVGLVVQALLAAVVALLPSAAATAKAAEVAQHQAELEAVPVTVEERIGGHMGSPTPADVAAAAERFKADGYAEVSPGKWRRVRK